MNRRKFLLVGAAGAAAGACDASGEPVAYPTAPASRKDLDAFFARLDNGLVQIGAGNPMQAVFERTELQLRDASPEDVRRHEDLYRKSLRSLLLSGSYRDLPPDAKDDPEMSARLIRGGAEMDEAVKGIVQHFEGLDDEQRKAIQTRLRRRPELGDLIGDALDREAAEIGVSPERRRHLQLLVSQASWRLRAQPIATFIDEHSALVRAVAERQYARVVDELRASTASTPMKTAKSSTTTVGAVLLGVAAGLGIMGGALLGGGSIAGAFVLTAGGILLVAGLIVLIVGLATS